MAWSSPPKRRCSSDDGSQSPQDIDRGRDQEKPADALHSLEKRRLVLEGVRLAGST